MPWKDGQAVKVHLKIQRHFWRELEMKKGNCPERKRRKRECTEDGDGHAGQIFNRTFERERERVKQREQVEHFKQMTLNRLRGWGRMEPWEVRLQG